MPDLTRAARAALLILIILPPVSANTYCDARGCSFPDHMGDIQTMADFLRRAGIPVKTANCEQGYLGTFSTHPAPTGSMTICTSALKRGAAGVGETLRHEMIHAAQFCKARNNGRTGYWTISNNRDSILKNSVAMGVYKHVGGSYGLLSEHEAYTHESARPRDVLYHFQRYCIDRKK